ncbi:hypothetical protein BCR33DRAFT_719664 [Rhizoclosmatium globosum]|uniref:VPS37 C-terminal domain-containing protein n=1 Tax=Rhizoclosmatium globosum TaxID=329046 RepID=A0A1Y2C0J5_9FUNG|nr:hypothetical protein BCR33DRAFT_719664 [Rhizoclosmatium globosum]|eukprot:ORY39835.1 hypothetical protein BCR33DRAFT_719664 [Rhizoclosmatium globosum]
MLLQPSIQQQQQQLYDAQQAFSNARAEFDETCAEYESTMLVYAPDYLLSRLRAAQHESEELGDEVRNEMLKGDISVDEFMKRYRDVRKVYHSRGLRVEKAERDVTVLM